jgi:predicted transcriptional regulator
MVKTNSTNKSVRSFRLSREGNRQLKELAQDMGRSEGNVIEIALDRMYREEIRFSRKVGESENADPEGNYQAGNINEEKLQ